MAQLYEFEKFSYMFNFFNIFEKYIFLFIKKNFFVLFFVKCLTFYYVVFLIYFKLNYEYVEAYFRKNNQGHTISVFKSSYIKRKLKLRIQLKLKYIYIFRKHVFTCFLEGANIEKWNFILLYLKDLSLLIKQEVLTRATRVKECS